MSISRARIRWRCRRGLKELDVFFEAFVETGLQDLPDAQLPALERILTMQDQDILASLLGDETPVRAHAGDAGVAVIHAIRQCRPDSESRD